MDINLIEYLRYRVEALERENESLKQDLNQCLTQLDLEQ